MTVGALFLNDYSTVSNVSNLSNCFPCRVEEASQRSQLELLATWVDPGQVGHAQCVMRVRRPSTNDGLVRAREG